MHRQSPLTQGFVGYTGGGARSLVDAVDDGTGMQEMKGSFMRGEARAKIESPQNYGFTSVVRPAKKDKDGKIERCAEAYINFMGGNRSFPVAAVMDDRRYRPWGLKPGENAQFDDIGQMTLMRRNGLYLLTLDSEEDFDNSDPAPGQHVEKGKKIERMVSLRHVEKKRQERPKKTPSAGQPQGDSAGGATPTQQAETASDPNGKDHKHEGETVNTEVRATAKDIQILDGETVVARYDKASGQWTFTSKKIKLEASDTFEIKAKTINVEASNDMTIRAKLDVLDIFGKPIKFNGGGPSTPPFTVPG
ncbi:MAG TPA: phage baseplate assembly protein [Xanthobacteraceae bacterium]|jgi:phage gp45-like|nr:phage baseplate assembly protein [Xanthobacteraceae bacterium]